MIFTFLTDFILKIFSRSTNPKINDTIYIVIEIKILLNFVTISNVVNIIHIDIELMKDKYIDFLTNMENITKKHILIPNSAGITIADSDAKF